MGLLKETNAQYYAGQQYIGNISNFTAKGSYTGSKEPEEQGNKYYLLIENWNFDTEPISAYGPYSSVNPITETSNYIIYYQAIGTVKNDDGSIDYNIGEWIALPESISFVSNNLTKNKRYIRCLL